MALFFSSGAFFVLLGALMLHQGLNAFALQSSIVAGFFVLFGQHLRVTTLDSENLEVTVPEQETENE